MRIASQQSLGAGELGSLRRAPDSVVADFDHASWQNMLEETVEELVRGKHDAPHCLSAIVAVAEADLTIVERFQSAVGDGDAEDVAAEIVEDLSTAPGRFAVDDPVFLPE